MSGNKVDGNVHGSEEFEFSGPDGGGLLTMNERVTRLATALRQKLKNQIQQYGEEPVRELMPFLVEVLEMLNSALQDERELQDLKEENQQLMKQYQTVKEKKLQAEKALIHLEDELTSERKDAKDEVQQLKTTARQLQFQLKNYRERAERMEQRHDQLQTDHAELQEKHRKMLQQYVAFARSSSKISTGRSLRALSEDFTRIAPLSMIQGAGSLNDSFEQVQPVSPSSHMLSSSPKPLESPVSGNRPDPCSPNIRKHLQREIEESTKVTAAARQLSEYTIQESTEEGFQFDMDVQETAKILSSDSEVRTTPVGSSDVETAVKSRSDTMKSEENEVLGQRTNQPGDGQNVLSLTGEVVDQTDVDRQDEEMFAREKEFMTQSWSDRTMPNEECLYDELGHDSAAEVDESAEMSRVSIEIQQLVNENRQLQEKGY